MVEKRRVLLLTTADTKLKLKKILKSHELKQDLDIENTVTILDFYSELFGNRRHPDAIVLETLKDEYHFNGIIKCLRAQYYRNWLYQIGDIEASKDRFAQLFFTNDDLGLRRLIASLHSSLHQEMSPFKERRESSSMKILNRSFENLQVSFERLPNGTNKGVVGLDANGSIAFINPVAEKLFGREPAELLGKPFSEFAYDSPLTLGATPNQFEKLNQPARSGRGLIQRADGSEILVEYSHSFVRRTVDQSNLSQNHVASCVSLMLIEDLTERLQFSSALKAMATYDSLTGLYNRAYYEVTVQQELSSSQKTGWPLCQCLINLDGFKQINDQYGHMIGDETLIEIGRRLTACLRRDDLVARLGGDEFVVLFRGVSIESAKEIAEKIKQAIRLPLSIEGCTFELSCSIGVYMINEAGESLNDILKKSDEVIYAVKRSGSGDIAVYNG